MERNQRARDEDDQRDEMAHVHRELSKKHTTLRGELAMSCVTTISDDCGDRHVRLGSPCDPEQGSTLRSVGGRLWKARDHARVVGSAYALPLRQYREIVWPS